MRRLMLDMSQTNLADGLGLTFQQVQKYEFHADQKRRASPPHREAGPANRHESQVTTSPEAITSAQGAADSRFGSNATTRQMPTLCRRT
jgi:hypothetical protein